MNGSHCGGVWAKGSSSEAAAPRGAFPLHPPYTVLHFVLQTGCQSTFQSVTHKLPVGCVQRMREKRLEWKLYKNYKDSLHKYR